MMPMNNELIESNILSRNMNSNQNVLIDSSIAYPNHNHVYVKQKFFNSPNRGIEESNSKGPNNHSVNIIHVSHGTPFTIKEKLRYPRKRRFSTMTSNSLTALSNISFPSKINQKSNIRNRNDNKQNQR